MANAGSKNKYASKVVLVAVHDEDVAGLITKILTKDYGMKRIERASNGEAAWKELSDTDFDFVILDWGLPLLSGTILFNRMRQHVRYYNIPVLAVSELQQKENFSLLKDYPFTGLLDGQFAENTFTLRVDTLLQEGDWYEGHRTKLDHIASRMEDEPGACKTLLEELIKSAPNPVPFLCLAGRKFRELHEYDQAEEMLKRALQLDSSSPIAVAEMAKVYHWSGRHAEALEIMQAQKFSMKNIERLLLLGEVNLAEKQPEEARKLFRAALAIDADNERAKSGVLVADNLQTFLSQNNSETLPETFASLLNLIGINMVKTGKQEEGLLQYKAALAFVHDQVAQARLMYNLGLGYLKWSKKEEAKAWFKESAKLGGDEFTKASEQLARFGKVHDDEEPLIAGKKSAS